MDPSTFPSYQVKRPRALVCPDCMKMRVALLETDEEVAHMNHMAANPVSDAPPPGTKWARSDTKRRIWYAMACTQHRRLLSPERASRGPRPPAV